MNQNCVVIQVRVMVDQETEENVSVGGGSLVIDILKQRGILPDEAVATINDRPVPVDEVLQQNDLLKIFIVSSGG